MKALTKAQLAAENVELRKNNAELRAQLEAREYEVKGLHEDLDDRARVATLWGEAARAARAEAMRTGRAVKVGG